MEEAPNKPLLDEKPLPPIEPPSAGFLIQLFVIPLVIVSIIVMVWLMFSWLAHMGSNPQELVRDLRTPNEASWQKANTLAALLSDPDHADLKSDVGMASELAKILDAQLDEENYDETSIRLRMFLCRALGEFKVTVGLPTIVKASTVERDPAEIDVRRTALEALAVLAANNGSEVLTSNEPCMEALKTASRERTDVESEKQARGDLRSTAAYVLGVLGGAEALDRLVILLDDPYTNTRYNAAVGLCRHGDIRATPVLLEMLDPENEESGRGEEYDSGKAWKRLQVINTGIRGAAQLADRHSADEMQKVTEALQRIVDSELATFGKRVRHGIRLNAEEVVQSMTSPSPKSD
ncbi:MAG: hypothetical protein CMJ64_27080 [Planctomycetaceae bacterium]|nr:hypothetical protein [Planctomycetaceae bacterium]